MYTSALKTLTQIKLEILAGLCYEDLLLTNLWTLLQSLGPYCGQKAFIDLLAASPKATSPEFQTMILFSDCMSHTLVCCFHSSYGFIFEKFSIIRHFKST